MILLVVFEILVGAYFPMMGEVKSGLPIGDVRTTMVNLFYIPMNLVLTVVKVGTAFMFAETGAWVFGIPEKYQCLIIFCIATVMMYASGLCLWQAERLVALEESSSEDDEFTDESDDDEADHDNLEEKKAAPPVKLN